MNETQVLAEMKQEYKYGFHDPEKYVFKARKGLDHEIIDQISDMKGEPDWMRQFRHRALDIFLQKPLPTWGGDLSGINFDDIYYYIKPAEKQGRSWDDVPPDIKRTFDRLGIPEAERKFLAGVGAQYECLSGDSRVATARGPVPIREVEPGDIVFAFDETENRLIPAPVKGRAYKGERKVFEVRVRNRTIRATANHPFLTLSYHREQGKRRGRYTREWKYLRDLRPGDLVALAKQLPDVGQPYTLAQPEVKTKVVGRNQTGAEYELDISSRYNSEFIGFVRIESITAAGVEPVYDIEVEGPHNFVAEGLIVHNSEVVYHSLKEEWEKLGVIFLDTDSALRQHPDLFREYFGTIVPPADNKFAALNSAVWSGGSFIFVPKGVKLDIPLQAYFRINAQNMGQFERTLIIVDEGASVHYTEGCLPAGEQVCTGERWVNVESLRPGDVVLDSRGMETRVRAVMARPYRGDLIEIQPLSAGNTFRLTPEHPVLAVKRQDVAVKRKARKDWLVEVSTDNLLKSEPRFIPAGELERGDFLVFPISKVVRDQARYTPEVLRLLGYYLAEGSAFVHNKLNVPVVSFALGEAERPLIEEIKELIRQVTGKEPMEVAQPERHGVDVRVYSQALMDLCLKACSKLAAHKQLSKEVVELPPDKQTYLLETYLKGDGSTYQRHSLMVRASTASETLARQLQELLARQGHYATLSLRKGGRDVILGRPIERGDQYILYYSAGKRQGEVRWAGDYFLVPIKGIKRIPHDGPVFNFEVSGDPNAYLVRGFAVHNCTAPIYASDSLHSAVVEIIVKQGGRCRYTTIQNWSNNVYNLVTKRAVAYEDAVMEWIDGNLGSKLTMKYPAVYMLGKGARAEVLSIAFAGRGQHQDAGAKVVHGAPYTSSRITSKSISKDGGRTSYRGLLKVAEGAKGSRSNVVCDALILDERSRSDTYPYIEIDEDDVTIGHEATVSKIGEEQLFYLMSRGLTEEAAATMIVSGFIEPMVKELPMEYAVEMNRLIQLQMEGSVG